MTDIIRELLALGLRSSLARAGGADSARRGLSVGSALVASSMGCTVAVDLDQFSFQADTAGAGGAESAAQYDADTSNGANPGDLRGRGGAPSRGSVDTGPSGSVGEQGLTDASTTSGGVGGPTGSEGSGSKDAGQHGPPVSDVDACAPVTLYRDADGDELGDVSYTGLGCPSEGWVTEPGDCRDDLAEVHPGQQAYFSVPYPVPNGVSFDYDCTNREDPDIENTTLAPVPTCAGQLGLRCEGAGYLPREPIRSGEGVDPRCGSNIRRSCESSALTCFAVDVSLDDSLRFRCK